MTRPFSLYLHIPFCTHKCPYCDFNTYAVTALPEQEYIEALLVEIDTMASRDEWRGRTVQTIFFGGGTPSLLSARAISKIINVVRGYFELATHAEISLEANPGSVSSDTLHGYFDAGVNRLSFGAQSFRAHVLRALGRLHSPEQIEAAVAAARHVGFNNLSIDLIFGAPEQTYQDFEFDIQQIKQIAPQHLSLYGLTIEEGTPFFASYSRGDLKLPHEDEVAAMFENAAVLIAGIGLERYEISNFARPGFEARHNSAYWNGDDYLGLGAGAHSFVRKFAPIDGSHGVRWSNFAQPKEYMRRVLEDGAAISWQDQIDRDAAAFEFFFLGLRRTRGVRFSDFEAQFGCTVQQAYPHVVELLIEEGFLTTIDDGVKLSERGLVLADSVIENFARSDNSKTNRHDLWSNAEKGRSPV